MSFQYKFGSISSMDASPSFRLLAVGGREHLKVIQLGLDGPSGGAFGSQRMLNYKSKKNTRLSVNEVCWSKRQEDTFAVSSSNSDFLVLNVQRMDEVINLKVRTHSSQASNITAIDYCPHHDHLIALGFLENEIRVVDVRQTKDQLQGGCVFNDRDPEAKVRSIKFNPLDSNYIAAGFESGVVQIFDLRKAGREMSSVAKRNCHNLQCSVAWSPYRRGYLSTACLDRQIKIWYASPDDLQQKCKVTHYTGVSQIRWSKRDEYSFGVIGLNLNIDNTVSFYSLKEKYRPYAVFKGHRDCIKTFLISNNDKYVITGSNDYKIIVHPFQSADFPYKSCPLNPLTFGPDNEIFAHLSQANRLPTFEFQNVDPKEPRKARKESLSISKNDLALFGQKSVLSQFLQRKIEVFKICNSFPTFSSKEVNLYFRHYLRGDHSLEKICKHNSRLAESNGKVEIAELWLDAFRLFRESVVPSSSAPSQLTVKQVIGYYSSRAPDFETAILDGVVKAQNNVIAVQKLAAQSMLESVGKDREAELGTLDSVKEEVFLQKLQGQVDEGQLQSAVEIFLAVERYLNSEVVKKYNINIWLFQLIDLVRKLQLYRYANLIIRAGAKYLGEESDHYQLKVRCSGCEKIIHETNCEHCGNRPVCRICGNNLDGLVFFCQVCSHSWHMSQTKDWFARSSICPDPHCDHECRAIYKQYRKGK